MSVLVTFNGMDLWYTGESLSDLGHALAPLEHCNEQGEVWSLGDSFAHVFEDGAIRRFGREIGRVENLIPIKAIGERPQIVDISPEGRVAKK